MNAQDRALSGFASETELTNDAETDSFQMVRTAGQQIIETPNLMPVPLPLEIPPPPNLSQLPAHILHSGTVETLLGQNDDLMARLKVNVRRNSLLEQQIMEQDRQHAELKHAHATLTAQYQVLQEKGEMLREKSQTFDIQTEELRDQMDLMQAKVDGAEERRDELHAGLKFERSYRRRIRAWVRPFINDLKAQLAETQTRMNFLDRQLGTREAVIGDLRERLSQTIAQMQTLTVNTNQNQSMLIEGYETRLRQAETDSAKAKAEASLLKEKASRLDEANSARAIADNKIISLERRTTEIEVQVTTFRQEAKTLAAEAMTANEQREEAVRAATEARAELLRVQDQLESMQAVWSEAQKKFEASKLQQDALNKLNQELSRQLRYERKQRESGFETPAASAAAAAAAAVNSAKISTEVSNARIGKIDSILAELESGFTKSKVDFVDEPQAPQGL